MLFKNFILLFFVFITLSTSTQALPQKDPYEVLGVTRSMPFKDIRMAYFKKASIKHQVDTGEGDDGLLAELKEINSAYEAIKEEFDNGGPRQVPPHQAHNETHTSDNATGGTYDWESYWKEFWKENSDQQDSAAAQEQAEKRARDAEARKQRQASTRDLTPTFDPDTFASVFMEELLKVKTFSEDYLYRFGSAMIRQAIPQFLNADVPAKRFADLFLSILVDKSQQFAVDEVGVKLMSTAIKCSFSLLLLTRNQFPDLYNEYFTAANRYMNHMLLLLDQKIVNEHLQSMADPLDVVKYSEIYAAMDVILLADTINQSKFSDHYADGACPLAFKSPRKKNTNIRD